MIQKDLHSFGKMLRRLRKSAGLYQDELAEKMGQIHFKAAPNFELRVDGNRVSKWERAFKGKDGREWRPRSQHILYLIEAFSDQLTLDAAIEWAGQAGYKLQHEDLQKFFPDEKVTPPTPLAPVSNLETGLRRLDILPEQRLFGIDQHLEQLRLRLENRGAPWLIAIDGIGGIGKTSLANLVARNAMSEGHFSDVAWISAKQEEFLPSQGLQPTGQPALTATTLTDTLLEQFAPQIPLAQPAPEKLAILTRLLRGSPHLIVIDNLETAVDYQTLLPALSQLTNPTKFLLTSRHHLHAQSDVFCLNLQGFSQADTFDFLKYEAEVRGVIDLANTSQATLEQIYEVVGGNPLALKLVVGQLRILPLSQLLENLRQAQGKNIDDLYTYIYWQTWQILGVADRQLLLVMPLTQNGTLEQLRVVSQLEPMKLTYSLQQLAALSLVLVGGTVEQRRYSIHRLTETFLLNEAIKWQLPG